MLLSPCVFCWFEYSWFDSNLPTTRDWSCPVVALVLLCVLVAKSTRCSKFVDSRLLTISVQGMRDDWRLNFRYVGYGVSSYCCPSMLSTDSVKMMTTSWMWNRKPQGCRECDWREAFAIIITLQRVDCYVKRRRHTARVSSEFSVNT